MIAIDARSPRALLQEIARRAMFARGLAPDFAPAAIAELGAIAGPARGGGGATRDLRHLLWCSIDNDDSRDLDQLSVAEVLPTGATKVLVAIADVAVLVQPRSAIDAHARQNTTSVYTVAQIFPMLPEKLSTDLTSLNFGEDRVAVVIEMVFSESGTLENADVYPAWVHNRAKLAYNSVAPWLEGKSEPPAAVSAVAGLAENLLQQDRVAQRLRWLRHERGALTFETIEARPTFAGEALKDIEAVKTNRAKHLIEDLMVAANGATAHFLAAKNFPSIRRVVRTPANWNRIVDLAAERGATLPAQPDVKALEAFLVKAKAADRVRFPDLSLSVIKLMGAGEYVLELPGAKSAGHFGLAVRDYAHSTAPNRRYPDLITQRLVKAAIAGEAPPYTDQELAALASHCTEQEDAAKKVERQVGKSAAALVFQNRIGEQFDAIVTGASAKGTWVRVLHPPVEGKLESGFEGRRVGDRVRVQLVHTDVERGFIDFRAAR
ncbi:MAG: RNB domain-containing ribonuclease [Opitutaceae bacterium]